MDETQKAALEELFEQALELPPGERQALLARACPDDPGARAELHTLLSVADDAASFFDRLSDACFSPEAWSSDRDKEARADPLDDALGRRLGQYEILDRLGGGGMGVVYRARDTRLDRIVALKFLPAHLSADEAAKERIRREARAVAALDHPNVCTIHEIAEDESGRAFLAMACYDGETLQDKVARGPLPMGEAVDYARQIAAGLSAAHAQWIIHRDVKPGNAIVTPEGVVKLLDFGLAKAADTPPTEDQKLLGTVGYLSPEQVRREPYDQRTDIWSLGVVLYEMLTGERPFVGEHAGAILHGILHEEPQPPSTRLLAIPPEIDAAIMRALAKSPDERPTSADEFSKLLDGSGAEAAASAEVSPGDQMSSLPRPPYEAGIHAAPRSRRAGPVAPPPASGRRRGLIAVSALAVVALAVVATLALKAPSSSYDSRRVLVDLFENRTGDPALDDLGLMATDWISQGLSYGRLVDVVSLGTPFLAPVAVEEPTGAGARAERIRNLAAAYATGIVVSGSFYQQGDSLYFQPHVTAARDDRELLSIEAVGAPADAPVAAVERLRDRLMVALAAISDPRVTDWADFASHPSTYQAYQEFVEILETYRANPVSSVIRDTYDRLVELTGEDSTFTLPAVWAMMIWRKRGGGINRYDSLALALDRRRETLPELDRHLLDFSLSHVNGNTPGALEAMRRVVEVAPSSEYLFYAAWTANEVLRPREAVRYLEQADPGSIWSEAPSAYWVALSIAHHWLGEYEQELEAMRRLRREDPEGAGLPWREARVLAALSRTEEFEAVFEELLETSPNAGNAMATMSQELQAHGHVDLAAGYMERALEWYRSEHSDDRTSRRVNRTWIFTLLMWLGRTDEAEPVLAAIRSDHPNRSDLGESLAILRAVQGRADEARQIARQLEEESPWINDWGQLRATVAALLGEREEAMRLLREEDRIGSLRFPWGLHRDMDLRSLWDYPPFQEFIAPRG